MILKRFAGLWFNFVSIDVPKLLCVYEIYFLTLLTHHCPLLHCVTAWSTAWVLSSKNQWEPFQLLAIIVIPAKAELLTKSSLVQISKLSPLLLNIDWRKTGYLKRYYPLGLSFISWNLISIQYFTNPLNKIQYFLYQLYKTLNYFWTTQQAVNL